MSSSYTPSPHLRPRYLATIPSNVSTRTSFDALGLAGTYHKRPAGRPVSRRANSGGSVLLPQTTTCAYSTPFSNQSTASPRSTPGRPRSASFDRPGTKKPFLGSSGGTESLSGYRSNRYPLVKGTTNASERSSRTSSLLSVASNLSSSAEWPPEIDYKVLYESQKAENEKLVERVKRMEELVNETIANNNQNGDQIDCCINSEGAIDSVPRVETERECLERRIGELENLSSAVDQLRLDNQRLKEENGALIRVISKLSR